VSIKSSSTVNPLDFSDLSGKQFERLAFATLMRMRLWESLSWHGQSGADGGRDIVGIYEDEWGRTATAVAACANWQAFTSTKATGDIDTFIKTLGAAPQEVIVITGSSVSAEIKDTIKVHALAKGVSKIETWSKTEFEERLRFYAPTVLQRFFQGEVLPDEEAALQRFACEFDPTKERSAVELLAKVFRRPAFTTPIHAESSLPAFRRAIGDTIGAVNTGIWRDREGCIIAKVPSLLNFSNHPQIESELRSCVSALNKLRIAFDSGLKAKRIRPCHPSDPDSPMFDIDMDEREKLERLREQALQHAQTALRSMGVDLDLRPD